MLTCHIFAYIYFQLIVKTKIRNKSQSLTLLRIKPRCDVITSESKLFICAYLLGATSKKIPFVAFLKLQVLFDQREFI